MINYTNEQHAFEEWNQTNFLPSLSQLIFYKLFIRFNSSGWEEWISVRNHELMLDCRISSELTFRRYRNILIESGLFEYQKGHKGFPNKYRYIPFCQTNKDDDLYSKICCTNQDQNISQSEVQNKAYNHDIIKVDKKKKIDSLSDVVEEKESISNQIDYNTIMKMFNSSGFFPMLTEMTLPRRNAIRKLFEKYDILVLEKVIAMVGCSDYLSGKTTNWRCSFDWLVKPENFIKVLEGNYANNKKSPSKTSNEQEVDSDFDYDYGIILE